MSDANSKNAKSTSKSNKQSDDLNRHNKIEAEAYALASARGFSNGNEMDDWLEAEKIVDTQLSR
ncbi:DUF2934 domain-containing protein [Paraglaciecola sp. 25GB23A]|uniref:DUF2934 domain-containing protein n=1 Tax=Paraglaciecola sp. 25GB23A TaxID=3156068 RepID=UPI0032AF0D83